MVLDPIPQSLPVHSFGSRPQPPTSLNDVIDSLARYNACGFETWRIHMWHGASTRDTTHVHVRWFIDMWHASFILRFISIWHDSSRRIHVWHDTFTRHMSHSRATWLIYMWHDSFTLCFIYVWHDSFACDMTHSHLFTCATRYMRTWDVTHSHVTWLIHTCPKLFTLCFSHVRHDAFMWHHSHVRHDACIIQDRVSTTRIYS